MPSVQDESLLLALPDAPLLRVLRSLAADDDQRSLCSAARTHSRLHQAVPEVLGSIKAQGITRQQQMDAVMQYLGRHGQHVNSISLMGDASSYYDYITVDLRQLPQNLQALSSLRLENFRLQMQPGGGAQGVLGAAAGALFPALTQLQLSDCALLDGGEGLAAALEQLPGLKHLSIRDILERLPLARDVTFPSSVLQSLQQLTYLELRSEGDFRLVGPNPVDPVGRVLQPLQALNQLQDLRVALAADEDVSASMLAGAVQLTRLQIELDYGAVEPGVLAGKSQLQHLELVSCMILGSPAGEVQLLSLLQHCTQLTHLSFRHSVFSLVADDDIPPPAAAFATLTASSRLRHLDISDCFLPAGVWEHMFPPGRQLPHLSRLDISSVTHPPNGDPEQPGGLAREEPAAAPDGSLLISCCPGLLHLDIQRLNISAALLPTLSGLSQLHTLLVARSWRSTGVGELPAVAQLTGLRELHLVAGRCGASAAEELLLQLTALRGLTQLQYEAEFEVAGAYTTVKVATTAPGDEPVWRQLLRRLCDSSNPEVAQQAAAALAVAE